MNERTGEEVPRTIGRRRRRRLMTILYLVLNVAALTFGFAKSGRIDVALTLLLIAFVFYAVQMYPVMQDLTQRKVSKLDERELLVHGRAYFRAYRMLGVIAGFALAYAGIALDYTGSLAYRGIHLPFPDTSGEFSFLSMFYMYLLISLPAAIVAWSEPDAPDMDED